MISCLKLSTKPMLLLVISLSAAFPFSLAPVAYGAAPDAGIAFDGIGTAAVVEDGAAFDMDALSISAWANMRHTTGSQVFVNRGAAGELFTLYLFQGDVRMLVEYADGDYTHANAPAPPEDAWVHYLGTYDGEEIRLYVDGELADATSASGRIPERDATLYIGALGPFNRVLDGELEDIRIWSRALSPAEAADVAQGANGGSLADGLVAHWRVDGLDNGTWAGAFAAAPSAEYHEEGPTVIADEKFDGYRGIWFTLGQFDDYGDKYSGGLGTYTAKHKPLAIYSEEVNKTFFVYGGTPDADERDLLVMASYFDHETGQVPRPTLVHDKDTDDPHDNPSMFIDGDGHVWVFVSGRGRRRPGFIYKSVESYCTDAFERVYTGEFTYPQPWWIEGRGFLNLNTKYTDGRELYFETSPDGHEWSETQKLAGMGGHYQTSRERDGRVITAFNYHPGGTVDLRTNLYYMETSDFGETWTTIEGEPLELPLEDTQNPALVRDYEDEKRLVYVKDIDLDAEGNPVVLIVTAADHRAGPWGHPRFWTLAHWNGSEWEFRDIAPAYHNYDMGSLYIENDHWRLIAPTEPGPQHHGTGGEMALWISNDSGHAWEKERDITTDSVRNHKYARRPVNAHPDFYAFWADGDPDELSISRIHFTNRAGDTVWTLPYTMEEDYATPME